jgi:hypothetical protein
MPRNMLAPPVQNALVTMDEDGNINYPVTPIFSRFAPQPEASGYQATGNAVLARLLKGIDATISMPRQALMGRQTTPDDAMGFAGAAMTGGMPFGPVGEGVLGSSAVNLFNKAKLDRLKVPEYKSREKLIEMPIRDFLALADKGFDEQKAKNVKAVLASGKQFDDIPFLGVDRNGRVDSHEGRHRAMALLEQGYETMPVRIKHSDIRWSEQSDPKRFDYVKDWPIFLQAQSEASNPNFKIPFPILREYANAPYSAD